MLNFIFITVVLMLQLNVNHVYIPWFIGGGIKLEPIGFAFMLVYGIVIFIQVFGESFTPLHNTLLQRLQTNTIPHHTKQHHTTPHHTTPHHATPHHTTPHHTTPHHTTPHHITSHHTTPYTTPLRDVESPHKHLSAYDGFHQPPVYHHRLQGTTAH